MGMTEVEKIEKYGKQCMQCTPNTLLPYEYDLTCFSFNYNVIKRKDEITACKRKKNFIKRLKDVRERLFVFVLMFKKYMKMKIYMKILMFYQDSKVWQ